MSGARLGYVGLGNIGGPMAARLAKWPGGLSVFDLAPQAVATLVDQGAGAAQSLADLGSRADIIGICVVDDDQVRTVVAGDGGLLSTAAPGTIITVHSTISPDTATELAQTCAASGVVLLDAPISGGAPGAEQGRLAIMVGGDRDSYTRIKEPFALTADMIVHAGNDVGAGTKMKLARNLLHFISFTATTEAARLAEAAGIDIAKLGKVVRHTDAITGGAGAIMLRDTTAPIDPDDFWYGIFTHVRTLGEKDLGLALGLAEQLGVDLPLGQIALRDLADGLGVGHAHKGESS
ncbi:3-hydroxyisobutyrate dehydrogenase [Gordonia bronchialis DSM 43247]|uniref:3-hydroxyisobutyrate dehydrogenase n=1 Tax=Gordonia bronchialis (strain ATCC 25592 / DSM 43247 / BCRC 13721 / JCM 3198 / KCTC 3076 / NBRC 16047 / NCTC 10667) TaxID=526226 RepID=D0L397_GORB4|nr:NAD(P)-dependent oxidoreductase [Gordonia bronchialis]ACY23027.1 3-hydroxyisobutyrate dehydrogenase [Gordonia bronchialis DSM 43247]MCC3325806.1 NAD(P)-dependent oxidoreductase [Gordonia bronchialis]QGS23547.1 NAD-binding protein [Gordonia bronchialis]STQ65979.1 2-hydroxy-3-oxopropionate reductase [Gordonia bronchialis]